MKILLNMIGGPQWVGGQMYILNLAKCLASVRSDHPAIEIRLLVCDKSSVDSSIEASFTIFRLSWWQQLFISVYGIVCSIGPLRYLSSFGVFKKGFFYPSTSGRPLPWRSGSWIPDFQHIHMPELFSEQDIRARNCAFGRMAKSSSLVVVSSEMARRDFVRLYPYASSKVKVLKFGSLIDGNVLSTTPADVIWRYSLPARFFLVCNQMWMHKDHGVIVDALEILAKTGVRPIVVCTGAMEDYRNPNYPKDFVSKVSYAGLGEQFRMLGFIPRLDQLQLMRACLAVVQPSRFEGWSTVVEDARSLGKSAILSDFPVHIEQSPPGALYFPIGNPQRLAEHLSTAWNYWSPGPELAREQLALEESTIRMRDVGKEFLSIVNSTGR
jgi:glycosyltransferase involved in cell wall biosynthesis